jgi:hypothetical protein
MTDALAMMPEGTVLTLTRSYVIPADSAIVSLNTTGGKHNAGSFENIHLTFDKSAKWRMLEKGTQFTVEGFVYLGNTNAFKFLLNRDDVILYVSGLIRPMEMKIEVMDEYFDIKFPPMEIYGTDKYVAPRDTIIIHPLLPGQVDSLQNTIAKPVEKK